MPSIGIGLIGAVTSSDFCFADNKFLTLNELDGIVGVFRLELLGDSLLILISAETGVMIRKKRANKY